jgi:hypothetical protein
VLVETKGLVFGRKFKLKPAGKVMACDLFWAVCQFGGVSGGQVEAEEIAADSHDWPVDGLVQRWRDCIFAVRTDSTYRSSFPFLFCPFLVLRFPHICLGLAPGKNQAEQK